MDERAVGNNTAQQQHTQYPPGAGKGQPQNQTELLVFRHIDQEYRKWAGTPIIAMLSGTKGAGTCHDSERES